MASLMDGLHLWGIGLIQLSQRVFQSYSETMMFVTKLGDPRAAFLVYYPLAFIVRPSVGINVVWVGAISEFANTVFKWFLYGQRPYWWVYTSGLYDDPPRLAQYRLTCETGPGSPSGHCMVTAAVLYVMLSAVIRERRNKGQARFPHAVALWSAFVLFMSSIGLSRCFIATHFPHQVAAGILAGVAVAMVCERVLPSTHQLSHFLLVAMAMLTIGLGLFWLLLTLGFDPLWSVSLAQTHCANPAWIHLDTTLFFALVKDASSLTGLGLALYFTTRGNPDSAGLPPMATRVAALVALAVTQGSEYVTLPQTSELTFYVLGFVKNAMVVYAVVLIRAVFVSLVGSSEPPEKKSS